MKRVVLLMLTAMVLVSCKPQKPWSPYSNESGAQSDTAANSATKSSSPNDRYDADIGDVEQAVFVDGRIDADSAGPNASVKEVRDRNKQLVKLDIVLAPPHPESLWADFEVKCSRNFMSAPVILRARVMVDDKDAGGFSTVLGTTAKKSRLHVKVDLLKPFQGNLPDTFLAKLTGDLYLMPPGTDENKVNPDTATSDIHSQALYGTMVRVDVATTAPAEPTPEQAGTPPEPAPPADPGATPPVQ